MSESWISVLQSCPCRLSLFVAALELQPEPATPRQLRHLTSTARLPCPTLPSLPPQFASGYCTVHSPHHCTSAPVPPCCGLRTALGGRGGLPGRVEHNCSAAKSPKSQETFPPLPKCFRGSDPLASMLRSFPKAPEPCPAMSSVCPFPGIVLPGGGWAAF